MGAEFVEVPVAILLHFFWRVDGQGPVGVHGDHHAADVRLQGGTKFSTKHLLSSAPMTGAPQHLSVSPSGH